MASLFNPWFLLWFTLNIGVTLINKTFFSTLKAPFPATITFVHMLVSGTLAIMTLKVCSGRYNARRPSPATEHRLYAMSFLFVLNILAGNASLNYCSIAFVQMVRCTIPAFTAVFSYIFLGTKTSPRVAATLVPIICGAALVCYGELRLTAFGFFLTIFGCVLSSSKTVLTKVFLSGEENVHPFVLLQIISSLGAVELVPVIMLTESAFYETWLPRQNQGVLLLLFLHGVCAFLLNVSNFEANRATAPLLITIGGNVKSVVTVLLGVFLFDVPLTASFIAGALITFGGVAMYSRESYNEKMKKKLASSKVDAAGQV